MLRKTTLSLLFALSFTGSVYALTPAPSPSEGGDSLAAVISAINQTTTAVNQNTTATNNVPQATADKLSTQLNSISNQLQGVQDTQTKAWNEYVNMQADQRFTKSGDLSAYDFLNQTLYQPMNSLIQSNNTNNPFATNMVTWIENKKPFEKINTACLSYGAQSIQTTTLSNGETVSVNACGYDDTKNMYYQNEMAMTNETQYTQPDQIREFAKSMLVGLVPLGTSISVIPTTIVADILQSRMPGPNGEPSTMKHLENTLNNLFGSDFENGLANASPLDVARAQTVLMGLHDYMQFQQLKLQQDQLLMMATLMTEMRKLLNKQ